MCLELARQAIGLGNTGVGSLVVKADQVIGAAGGISSQYPLLSEATTETWRVRRLVLKRDANSATVMCDRDCGMRSGVNRWSMRFVESCSK